MRPGGNVPAPGQIVGFLRGDPLAGVHGVTGTLAHQFGAPIVGRGRGGFIVVTSGAAWAGGAAMAAYGATKAFDLILADGPTWIYGSADPAGASPLGALPRRTAVLALSNRASVAAPGK
jgi:hypothetical protein